MSTKDDGGPAFPQQRDASGNWAGEFGLGGMSLRDYFAGQALIGLTASIQGPGCASWDYYSGGAYQIADAMLAERAK